MITYSILIFFNKNLNFFVLSIKKIFINFTLLVANNHSNQLMTHENVRLCKSDPRESKF